MDKSRHPAPRSAQSRPLQAEHPGVSPTWFRYEARHYAPVLDEYGFARGSGRLEIAERVFERVRCTPKGVWLVEVWGPYRSGTKRFVRLDARKQYASPSREQALQAFLERKRAQVRILERRLDQARIALEVGKTRAQALQTLAAPMSGPPRREQVV